MSTVNNQPLNFDTINFDGRQHEYGPKLGGWNPFGSGNFRIVDASVVRVCTKDGTCTTQDHVVGAKFMGKILVNYFESWKGSLVIYITQFVKNLCMYLIPF